MADIVDSKTRSVMMSAVKHKNTKPELTVRRYLHARGLRYRLHRKDLPGKPDLVFSKRKIVVFINGCFWHRHDGCPKSYTPNSNIKFWENKFHKNVERDKRQTIELEKLGWKVIIIWECEINDRCLEELFEKICHTN